MAAGILGSPGIVIIEPQTTTKNSAPLDNLTSLIGKVWSDGAPFNLGSVEKLYWVFAIQTGKPPNPACSIFFICSLVVSLMSIPFALYISFATFSIFSKIGVSSEYKYLNFLLSFFLHNSTTLLAKSLVPFPPSDQCVQRLTFTPNLEQ